MKHIDQAFLKAYQQLPQTSRAAQVKPQPSPAPKASPGGTGGLSTAEASSAAAPVKPAPRSRIVPPGPHRPAPSKPATTVEPTVTEQQPAPVKPQPLAQAQPHTPAADTNTAAAVNQLSAVEPAALAQPAPARQRDVVAEAAQSILPAVAPLATIPPASGSQASLAHRQSVATFRWSDLDDTLNEVADADLTHLALELSRRAADGMKLLLVSSWSRSEGRTSLMLCLARHLADEGLKVAMVDGDFARPGLAERLGLDPECSWTRAVAGEASLSDCAIESEADRLVAYPLAVAGGTWPSGPRLRLVLGLLRRDYDLVLIDGGPIAEGNDPPAGWPQIDASIIVRDPNRTADEHLLEAETELAAAGIAVLGIAENFN